MNVLIVVVVLLLVAVLPGAMAALLTAILLRLVRGPQIEPYVSQGGPLPDFFHGHTWPVTASRLEIRQ